MVVLLNTSCHCDIKSKFQVSAGPFYCHFLWYFYLVLKIPLGFAVSTSVAVNNQVCNCVIRNRNQQLFIRLPSFPRCSLQRFTLVFFPLFHISLCFAVVRQGFSTWQGISQSVSNSTVTKLLLIPGNSECSAQCTQLRWLKRSHNWLRKIIIDLNKWIINHFRMPHATKL